MAKTKEELVTMIETELVDPTSKKITGDRVKNVLTEMVSAMGTGSSGGAAFEYWEGPSDNEVLLAMAMYGVTAKMSDSDGVITILPGGFTALLGSATVLAVCWCPGIKFYSEGTIFSSDELLMMLLGDAGVSSLEEAGLIRITEEQYLTV